VVRLVSRGVTDRSAHLPAPRGLGSWRTTSSPQNGRAHAQRTVSRRSHHPSGAFHGGSSPVDSAASGSPLPSSIFGGLSTVILEVLTTGERHMRKHARATLLTLTPTLPSRPVPYGPTCRSNCLSWGCPKIAPPSYRIEESDAQEWCFHLSLRGGTASPSRVPSAWFRTTSTDFPLRPCRSVSPCCRSWGSPCFFPSRNGPPHSAFLPSEAFPPPIATNPERVRLRGPASRVTIAGFPSPRALPPHPSLQAPCRRFPTSRPRRLLVRLPGDGASRPCSIVGSVVAAPVSRRDDPMLPWAWPAPLAAASSSVPVSLRRGSRRGTDVPAKPA